LSQRPERWLLVEIKSSFYYPLFMVESRLQFILLICAGF
jgi:hypothetical protein